MTTKSMKHTQGPFVVEGKNGMDDALFHIIPAGEGGTIASVWGDSKAGAKANAEFIVRACNSHEELLEAAKEIMESLMGSVDGRKLSTAREFQKLQVAIEKASC